LTQTVYGLVCDHDGIAAGEVLESGGAQGLRVRHAIWATPAGEVRREQPEEIPIDLDHDGRPRGQVVHLERTEAGLWAIGEVSGVGPSVSVCVSPGEVVEVPHDLFWSARRWGGPDTDGLIIDSLALTAFPASAGARPVTFFDGPLNERKSWPLNSFEKALLENAYESSLRRRSRDPITIHDPRPVELSWAGLREGDRAPVGLTRNALPSGLRTRPGQIISVR
jgi:hypothetical protein